MNLFITGLGPRPFVYQIQPVQDSRQIIHQTQQTPPNTPLSDPNASTTIQSIFTSFFNTKDITDIQLDEKHKDPNNPSLTSFKVLLNNTLLDPSSFNTTIINLFSTQIGLSQQAAQLTSVAPQTFPIIHDFTVAFLPRLLGGKGGFGANLRAAGNNKKKLPVDESLMRNRFGQRLGASTETQLLQQLERDLKKQEQIDGKDVGRMTITTVKKDSGNKGEGNKNYKDGNHAQNQLDSNSAIERLGIVIKDDNVVMGPGGTVMTAPEMVNDTLTQDDAIKKGLQKMTILPLSTQNVTISTTTTTTVVTQNTTHQNCNINIINSTSQNNNINAITTTSQQNRNINITTPALAVKKKKVTVDDCGLELSDDEDEDDDEDGE